MAQTVEAPLSAGAHRLVEAANDLAAGKSGGPGVNHWLLALVQRHGAMAESMTEGINAGILRDHLRKQLQDGETGEILDPQVLVRRAVDSAKLRGSELATERDLAAEILRSAGYELRSEPIAVATNAEPAYAVQSSEQRTITYTPRNTRPVPALAEFGQDVTRAAADGKLGPVVGRDAEIDLVIETLSRRTKRNPVLVGPAGVGKTAIVEGLARRVVCGEVPSILNGVRIFEVQPSTLVAGAGVVGELNERMKAIIQEASQDGVVLFIDEVHSMVGAGGPQGTGDIASLLKPALARGDLACIAATTDDEYRRFIEPDAALERRFQPIRVQELTTQQTMDVLAAVRDELERCRSVAVADDVLEWLLDFAGTYLRNRTFPDKAIDLLEQCVANAVSHGHETVEISDAEAVARRMIGMPTGVDDRLNALRDELATRGILSESETEALLNRLSVTMRGLDLQVSRPNAVVLLMGEVAKRAGDLCRLVAGALLGSEGRVVSIDFSRFTHPSDVTMLLGAAPGYVGYSDALPIHRIAQMPWIVLLCENIDTADPSVQQVLGQALANGFFTQADGKRVFLSDAVVLLTLSTDVTEHHAIGFHRTPVSESVRETAGSILPSIVADQVDLICSMPVDNTNQGRQWLEGSMLMDLSHRYKKYGIEVRYDPSLVSWLLEQEVSEDDGHHNWERLIDDRVSPALIPYVGTKRGTHRLLVVSYADGAVHVTAESTSEGGKE